MPGKRKGAHRLGVLTEAEIINLSEPGLYGDGNGLYLRVEKSGAKRWVQRITIGGKRRDLGLGSTSVVTLEEARANAIKNKKISMYFKVSKSSSAPLEFDLSREQSND
jgi:hypothetical protein